MIQNTFFSASRFAHLCRKEMIESWKVNVNRLVMMYGVLTIAFVWKGYSEYRYPSHLLGLGLEDDPVWSYAIIMFCLSLIIMGLLSASFVMEGMKTKTNRISMLMTPATMFEKFFSRWLVFTFGYLLMFLLAFRLADWTRVAICTISYPELKTLISSTPLSRMIGERDYLAAFDSWHFFVAAVGGYFFAQSLFVLGSSIWPKNAFIKTFTAIVAIGIVFGMVITGVVKLVPDPYVGQFLHPRISAETLMVGMAIIFSVMAVFNWIVAYFRFKESEIINRW